MSKQSLLNQRAEKLMGLSENSGQLDWVQLRGPWVWSFPLRTPYTRKMPPMGDLPPSLSELDLHHQAVLLLPAALLVDD